MPMIVKIILGINAARIGIREPASPKDMDKALIK